MPQASEEPLVVAIISGLCQVLCQRPKRFEALVRGDTGDSHVNEHHLIAVPATLHVGEPQALQPDLLARLHSGPQVDLALALEALRVAAGDNSLKEGDLLKQAQELFGALSGSLHAEESGGTTSAPAALFDPHGRTKMVAMAAIARFTGRNLALYGATRDSPVPIKLRVLSPLQRASCALSVEEVRAAQVLEF